MQEQVAVIKCGVIFEPDKHKQNTRLKERSSIFPKTCSPSTTSEADEQLTETWYFSLNWEKNMKHDYS